MEMISQEKQWRKIENVYYQKQIVDKFNVQATETVSLLTSALNIHSNIGQNLTMNISEVFMSLQNGFQIKQLNNLSSHFNFNINNTRTVSFRVCFSLNLSLLLFKSIMRPLASVDQSRSQSSTNLSTSILLSTLDRNGNELSLRTTLDHPFQFIIPRDPNLIISPMTL